MSPTNVDRFIEATDAFNRFSESPGTVSGEDLQAFLEIMDPEIRFEPQQAAVQGGYSGREGVTQWLTDLAETYSGGHLDYAEIRDLGGRVLALGTLQFVGRGSGIETESPIAVVADFRNGLITHFKDYGDSRKALEAAGVGD